LALFHKPLTFLENTDLLISNVVNYSRMSRLTSPWSYGKDIYTVDVSCLKKNVEGVGDLLYGDEKENKNKQIKLC
jgi:hypothetical protein